jgi:Flp pilus assembly pilin Flp
VEELEMQNENGKQKPVLSLIRDERGAGFSEYLVLLVMIVIFGIAIWKGFRDQVDTKVKGVNEKVQKME